MKKIMVLLCTTAAERVTTTLTEGFVVVPALVYVWVECTASVFSF